MKLRSHFSRVFFQKEATELTQIDYQKSLFHHEDKNLVAYLNWMHTVNKPGYTPGTPIEEPLKVRIDKEDEVYSFKPVEIKVPSLRPHRV
jgi:hypothetical protein